MVLQSGLSVSSVSPSIRLLPLLRLFASSIISTKISMACYFYPSAHGDLSCQAESVVLMADRQNDSSVLLSSFELELVMKDIPFGQKRPKLCTV